MGFFDSIGSGISGLFGNTDPLRAAQIRGAMLGAAQNLLQPYSNMGSALVGAGQGYQQGKENYLQDQYIGMRNAEMQDQLTRSKAQRDALNNLFLKTAPTQSSVGTMPSQALTPQTGQLDAEGNVLPSQPSGNPPTNPLPTQPQFKLPAGFDTPEQFQQYAQIDPEGALKRLYAPPEPMTVTPGTDVIDKNNPGHVLYHSDPRPNPNEPFNPDGTPNKAYQEYEAAKQRAAQAPAWANVELARDKLKAGIPDESTLHDMASRYVGGDRQAGVGLARNPAAVTAFQNMISQVGRERGLSQTQISQNLQTFQGATKAVQAFDTGKQGDITRSLNVSVSHLEILRELGKALQNGDVRLVNAARQRWQEEFGTPAPTNFDAAKSIVADEVAKGVIGGQTAQQDRETLAASLRRDRSFDAIDGSIGTFQKLLSGQLGGLRQQYKSSTQREDFNDKLSPETVAVLDRNSQKTAAVDPKVQAQLTDANIKATALKRNMKVDDVKKQLRDAGYEVP